MYYVMKAAQKLHITTHANLCDGEQARFVGVSSSICVSLSNKILCVLFQLQVNLQVNKPQPEPNMGSEDDIDRALSELQMSLEGSHVSTNPADIMQIPELGDYLKFMKCVIVHLYWGWALCSAKGGCKHYDKAFYYILVQEEHI